MKTNIVNNASRWLGMTGLKLKKHSPEILMVAGIAGTIASTVMACKATTKVSKIMEEKQKTVDTIHTCLEEGIDGYTEEDSKKDLTITYAQTGIKLAKLYAPAVALGALSITSIVAGHNILKKRNLALAAAYAVVDTGFKNYRKNVVDRFGDELDRELRYNIKAKEIEVEKVDENGKKKKVKEVVKTIDRSKFREVSQFARFFDDTCPDWQNNAEWNLMFLRKQQDWANEKLRSQGYLFLNDVYASLGMPKTAPGQEVGWIYKDTGTNDQCVDFGIYKNYEENRAFVNGYESSILLDFNVDGAIMHTFEQYELENYGTIR